MKDLNLPDGIASVYIAGKMRGEPCYNFERFFFWAHILRKEGLAVQNPAQIDTEKMFDGWQFTEEKYAEVLLHDFHVITNVDAVFLLNGWEQSDGAKAEKAFAEAIGKAVLFESNIVTKGEG